MPLRRSLSPLVLGASEGHSGFAGSFDELSIIPSVLTSEEVHRIYAANDVPIEDDEMEMEVRVTWAQGNNPDAVATALKKDLARILLAREDRLAIRPGTPPSKFHVGMYFKIVIQNGANDHMKPADLAKKFELFAKHVKFLSLDKALHTEVNVRLEHPPKKVTFSRLCPCLGPVKDDTKTSRHVYDLLSPAHSGMASGCTAPDFIKRAAVKNLASCEKMCDEEDRCNVINYGNGMCTLDQCSDSELKLQPGESADVYKRRGERIVTTATAWQKPLCTHVEEDQNASLSCPGGMLISRVVSANYGVVQGNCDQFDMGACKAEGVLQAFEQQCIGKSECSLQASTENFGNPCPVSKKSLLVQVQCRSLGKLQPPSKRSQELASLINSSNSTGGNHDSARSKIIQSLHMSLDFKYDFLNMKTDSDLAILSNTVRFGSFREFLKFNDRSDDELNGMSYSMLRKAFVGEVRKVINEDIEILEQLPDPELLNLVNNQEPDVDSHDGEAPNGIASSAALAASLSSVELGGSKTDAAHAAARAAAAAFTFRGTPAPKAVGAANEACRAYAQENCFGTALASAYSAGLADGLAPWNIGLHVAEAAQKGLNVPNKDLINVVGMAAAESVRAVGMPSSSIVTHAGLASAAAKFFLGGSPQSVEMTSSYMVTKLGGSKEKASKIALQALSLADQEKANNPDVTKQTVFDDGTTAGDFVGKPPKSTQAVRISVMFELVTELIRAINEDKASCANAVRDDVSRACNVVPAAVKVTVPFLTSSLRSPFLIDVAGCHPGDLKVYLKSLQHLHTFGTNFSAFCDKHSSPRPLQTKHVSTQSNSEPDEESGSDRTMEPSQSGSPDAAAKHEAELSFVAGRTLSLVADAAFKGSSSRGLSTKQAMKNAVTAVAKVAFETDLSADEWAHGVVSAVALGGGSKSDATCMAASAAADNAKENGDKNAEEGKLHTAALQAAGDAATRVQLLMKSKPGEAALAVQGCLQSAGFSFEEIIPLAIHAAGKAAASADHLDSFSILDAGHAAADAANSLGIEPARTCELACNEVAQSAMSMGATESETLGYTTKCVYKYGTVLLETALKAHSKLQDKLQKDADDARRAVSTASSSLDRNSDMSPKEKAKIVLSEKTKILEKHKAERPTPASIFSSEAKRIASSAQLSSSPTATAEQGKQDEFESELNALKDQVQAKEQETSEVDQELSDLTNKKLAPVNISGSKASSRRLLSHTAMEPDTAEVEDKIATATSISQKKHLELDALKNRYAQLSQSRPYSGHAHSPAEVSDVIGTILLAFGSSGPQLSAAIAQAAGLAAVARHQSPAEAAKAVFEAVEKHGGNKNAAVDLAISVCSQQVAASGGSAERLGDTVKGISAAIGGAPTQDLISAVSKGSFEVAKSLGGSYEQALAASAEAAFSAAHSFNMSVGRSAAAAAEAASALGGHESELTDAVGTAVGSYATRRKMKPSEAAAAVAAASIASGAHREAAAASAAQVAAQVAFTEGQSTKEVVKLSQTLVTGLGGSPESATAVSAVVAVPPVLTHQLDAPVAMDW